MGMLPDMILNLTPIALVNFSLHTYKFSRRLTYSGSDRRGIYTLPVPLERVMGVAILSNALQVPAVFTFLEMLRKFDFQSLAKSTYA